MAAAFNADNNLLSDDIEKITDKVYTCSSTGDAIMTRKDNDFSAHWNRGFQQLVSNGRFRKLCKEAQEKHGRLSQLCNNSLLLHEPIIERTRNLGDHTFVYSSFFI